MNNLIDDRNALPIGYRLENYQIQSILGDGGFGITYLAQDVELNTSVAIKEYLPNGLAVREPQDYSVQAKSQKEADKFAWGLERFVKEAQTLFQFKHPQIVRVLHFFHACNTAYIVMEYERGQNLAQFINEDDTVAEEKLMTFLPLLLDGLETIHKAGYLHRDIKPDNIYLRKKRLQSGVNRLWGSALRYR
jgi:serine/threonine protein kinase